MTTFLPRLSKVVGTNLLLLLIFTISEISTAQIKLLHEVKVSDSVMFFNGVNNQNSTNKDVNAPYDYSFGNALTPHGDCIKAFNDFVFMTWYRGGKEDRHVMLTRYNMKTGVAKTIEFPHRHTGFNGKWWIGETHNTIGIGICPKDSTIHMLYDQHRNANVEEFVKNNDVLRYSYSEKGAATVPDDQFTLERFVNSPAGNYKHQSFPGISGGNSDRITSMLTYPAFFTNDEGDLFLKNRFGYSRNGKFVFSRYDGNKWNGYYDFNYTEAQNHGSQYSWGLYGDIKYLNGKIRIGFQRRSGDRQDKYLYQNGIYYAYSDDPTGTSAWKDHKGAGFEVPLGDADRIKVAEPGDWVQTTQKDKVYIVGGFDYAVTDNEDVHIVSMVKDKQYNVTKKLHTYKSYGAQDFTTVEYNAGSELYAAGNDVFLIGLKNGRANIVKTKGGTSDFEEVYQHTTGPVFDKNVVYVQDGKLFFYLKKKGGSGSKRTTYLQVFDLDIDTSGGPSGYELAVNEGDTVEVTGTMDIAYGAKGEYVYLYDQTENCGCDSITFGSNPAPGEERHCYVKQVVFADGVSLDKNSLALTIGQSDQLLATVSPFNAKNKTLTWTSLDSTVAKVSEQGELEAIAIGSTVIIVKTEYGGFTDTCEVDVLEEIFPNIEYRDDEQIPNVAANLLDGKTTDNFRWSAQMYPKTAVIDYGESMGFTGSKLYAYQDRSYHYTIAISESPDSDFTTVVNQSGAASSQPIEHTFSETTGRYVKLTVTGCTNYASNWVSINELEMITAFPTGVEATELSKQISIFPNPADQFLTISLPKQNDISHVRIVNLNGQEILRKKVTGNKSNISIKELPRGVYIINISCGETHLISKFIKK